MASEQRCVCFCHRDVLADYRAALNVDDYVEAERLAGVYSYAKQWAAVDDPLEAAVATGCACVKNHVAVFARPAYKPPTHWRPESDATGDAD